LEHTRAGTRGDAVGFRLYKRVSLGKGIRLNLSKTGVGVSAGIPGLRYSVHSSGRTVKTVGLPGTGVYYRKDSYTSSRSRSGGTRSGQPAMPQVQMYPKAGLLASSAEKHFVKGVTAYMQGRYQDAVEVLREVMNRDAAQAHVAEELFAGMSLIALERLDEAIPLLETVVASNEELPDALMQKYRVGGEMRLSITPSVVAQLPLSHVGAGLLLAELYQQTGKSDRAIELLESLGSIAADPIFALSLAEVYAERSAWTDVIRVSKGFANSDDATCQLMALRANALYQLGLADAAVSASKEALRSKKRLPELLHHARYVRALAYEATGKKALARKDLERIYAEDSGFLDVEQRLGLKPTGVGREM
jgi:tetratricopeptide (TPR) repeat protein